MTADVVRTWPGSSWPVAVMILACGVSPRAQTQPTEPRTTEWAPRAYVQFDFRAYPDWDVATGTGRLEHETMEVRRLRVGMDGRWRRYAYEFTVDPLDDDGTLVKDAYVESRWNRTLRLRVGQFKLPGGAEHGRSARTIEFMERSTVAQSIAPGRDIGAMISGTLPRSLPYKLGVFAGDGNGRESRSELTIAGRLAWTGVSDLELGVSSSRGRTSAVDSDPANGLTGRSPSGYRFFERLYVNGARTRVGADAAWTPRRWRLRGEWLRARDQRREQGLDHEDLPAVVSDGWSAMVTREFGRRAGRARSRLREFELGLRLEGVSFDDAGPDTGVDSTRLRATDVRRRAAASVTATIGWSPISWARVLTNFGVERFSEPRSAPNTGRRGPYWTLATRLQIELP